MAAESATLDVLFTGVWEGVSIPQGVGKNGQPAAKTWWSKCNLMLTHNEATHYTLSGQGQSLWKSETIHFVLVGSLDSLKRTLTLYKTYQGKFTNTVAYECTYDARNRLIRGKWKHGVVYLSYLYKPDRVLHNFTADTLAPDIRTNYIAHRLTAIWEGVSTRRDSPVQTVWTQCELRFMKTHSMSGVVKGKGVSLWKKLSIPFLIDGEFDMERMSVSFRKKHTDPKFNSEVHYSLHINFPEMRLEGSFADGTLQLSRYADIGSGVNDADAYDVIDRLQITTHGGTMVINPNEIDPLTMMSLGRQRSNESTVSNETHTHYVVNPEAPRAGRMISGSGIRQTEVSSVEPVDQKDSIHGALGTYKAFLLALISSGSLDTAQLRTLAQYRRTQDITEQIHLQALEEIGMTQEEFDKLKKKVEVKTADEEPDDICKVCYDSKIDCVLLPCGHFAVCKRCSAKLRNKCPVCRSYFTQAKTVYRS